jgi:hypothetical protein
MELVTSLVVTILCQLLHGNIQSLGLRTTESSLRVPFTFYSCKVNRSSKRAKDHTWRHYIPGTVQHNNWVLTEVKHF